MNVSVSACAETSPPDCLFQLVVYIYIHINIYTISRSKKWLLNGAEIQALLSLLTVISLYIYMGVSKNRGTLKSSIFIGFSIINHPFWDTPIFGNIHMCIFTTARNFWYSRSRLQWRLYFPINSMKDPKLVVPVDQWSPVIFWLVVSNISFSSLFGEMIQFD